MEDQRGEVVPLESPGREALVKEHRLLAILRADPEIVAWRARELRAEYAEGLEEMTRGLTLGFPSQVVALGERAEFYESVLVVQRIAAQVGEGPGQGGTGDELRFRDFTVSDVALLGKVLARGETCEGHVVEGSTPDGGGWLNFADPDGECYHPLPPAHRVDLCISSPPWGMCDFPPERWIEESISLLVGCACRDQPRLRRCQMPQGSTDHLDFRLGVREEDVATCGSYYIPARSASTCGRPICQQNHTRLDNLEQELGARAQVRMWSRPRLRHPLHSRARSGGRRGAARCPRRST